MERNTTPSDSASFKAPIGALKDEETFLQFAQHLKALYLRRSDRVRHFQGALRTIEHQITIFAVQCDELAAHNPRCRAMWAEVKKELATFDTGS